MDSTVNPDPNPRLAELRAVRSWRACHSLPARAFTLVVPIAAFLAWCFLALGAAQARVQIEFDPMRPATSANATNAATAALPAASAASGAAAADAAPAAAALPTLKITRLTGAGSPGALSALVDDTWVRRGDVVAGYRVTALRTESIDLVTLAEPTQRLTLRLNPVVVDRNDAVKAAPAWAPLALEKKP